jgi:hypothetical protein
MYHIRLTLAMLYVSYWTYLSHALCILLCNVRLTLAMIYVSYSVMLLTLAMLYVFYSVMLDLQYTQGHIVVDHLQRRTACHV